VVPPVEVGACLFLWCDEPMVRPVAVWLGSRHI
jgi:hypothetical protein